MDDGGGGAEVVAAEGVVVGVLSPAEEAEDEVGIVFYSKGNLGKLVWGKAGRVESAEVAPAGLGALLG